MPNLVPIRSAVWAVGPDRQTEPQTEPKSKNKGLPSLAAEVQQTDRHTDITKVRFASRCFFRFFRFGAAEGDGRGAQRYAVNNIMPPQSCVQGLKPNLTHWINK